MASKKKTPHQSTSAKTPRVSKAQKTRAGSPTEALNRLSALDAAAKVLVETGRPMSCTEMIEAMAARGFWTSPGGKTPAATLYSAMLREIASKGTHSRFVKADRGKFALAVSAV